MILSNRDIQRAIERGALIIDPRPEPDTPIAGVECPYQTSAVDLRLGEELSILGKSPTAMDLRGPGLAQFLAKTSERVKLGEEQPYSLKPGKFILGKTYEMIGLPIRDEGPWYAARVEGRSSYARCGLLVHFTAPTIHAGFEGTITLEIMNFGQHAINLYPRTPICQLIIEQVSSKPFLNPSQFHGQSQASGTK